MEKHRIYIRGKWLRITTRDKVCKHIGGAKPRGDIHMVLIVQALNTHTICQSIPVFFTATSNSHASAVQISLWGASSKDFCKGHFSFLYKLNIPTFFVVKDCACSSVYKCIINEKFHTEFNNDLFTHTLSFSFISKLL